MRLLINTATLAAVSIQKLLLHTLKINDEDYNDTDDDNNKNNNYYYYYEYCMLKNTCLGYPLNCLYCFCCLQPVVVVVYSPVYTIYGR